MTTLTLAAREVRDALLTLRFQVGTALAVLLVAASVWGLTDDYARRLAGHTRRLALNEAHLADYGHLNRLGSVAAVGAPPAPLTAWVRGLSQGSRLEQFDNDPLPVLFPLVDMVAVVTVVLSLLALVFTFDLVSGERRAGTLRLLTTFGPSRPALVGGKLLGAAGTVAVPYTASWVVAALIVAVRSPAAWGVAEWSSAAAIAAGGFLYVLVFAALGTALSTLTREPRSSAFAALAAWVLLVLVVPNLAPFLAAQVRPLPSLTALQRRTSTMLDTERDALQDRLRGEAYERLGREDPAVRRYLALGTEERRRAAESDPALARAAEKVSAAGEEAIREGNRVQRERVDALYADFERRLDAQVDLARALSLASPAPAFTYLATDLAETGLRREQRLETQGRELGELVRRWRDDLLEELRTRDPHADWYNTPIDLSTMPRFAYESEPVAGRLAAAAPWFTALAVYALLFAGVAAAAFTRYDVR